ncbi:muscarinic acetylcholine receptor M3 isoform X1 [Hydra vulgaris]|uniref:muscarinic acetylcholine receptor M3 isoform X1 n=1 Tax=Hydra vulgaris TaxID=6087 RepID=UPI001F5FB92F|nr:muscarinic acetylcholine receptor M3-like [Hydra vulgaris]
MKPSLQNLLNDVLYTTRSSHFNITSTSFDNHQPVPRFANRDSIFIPPMIVGAIFSIVTIGGNFLIILAYFTNEKIRSVSNVPLLSLAFTDMFIGIIPVTMNILEMSMGYWPLGKEMCNVALMLDYVSVQSSINHIVLINFERYLAYKSPVKHQLLQKTSRVIVKLFTVWFIAVIIWAPFINIYTYKVRSDNPYNNQCYNQFSNVKDYKFKRYIFVTVSVTGYFLPLGIVIVTYWKMYFIIKQQLNQASNFFNASNYSANYSNYSAAKTTKWHSLTSPSDGMQDNTTDRQKNLDSIKSLKTILKHKKALRLIVSILSAFLLTGLPLNAQWLLVGMCPTCYNKTLFDVCNFLTYPNSLVNPFLYACASRTFRKEFKKLLLCGFFLNCISVSKKLHVNYRANCIANDQEYKELSQSVSTEII